MQITNHNSTHNIDIIYIQSGAKNENSDNKQPHSKVINKITSTISSVSSEGHLNNLHEALKHNINYQKSLKLHINKFRAILRQNNEKQVWLNDIL